MRDELLHCRACRAEIEAAGRAADLSARVEAHLATCAACRAFETQQTSLRSLLGTLEPVGAPADFEFRLRARMLAQQRAAPRFVLPRFAPRALALVVASLVLACAALINQYVSRPAVVDAPLTAQNNIMSAPTAPATPRSIETARPDAVATTRAAQRTISHSRQFIASALRRQSPVSRALTGASLAQHLPENTIVANDLSASGASVVTDVVIEPPPLPFMPVRLAAATKPLKIAFRDTQGTARLLTVEPVAFGSRDLPGARGNAATEQGVW